MIIIGIFTGAALSLFYFGGLWLTLNRVGQWRRPWILITGSFLIRNAVVLGIFYLLILQHWSVLIAALAAFMITRQVVIHKTGSTKNLTAVQSHGIQH
jgi:F1F0 ATPase subunit 2